MNLTRAFHTECLVRSLMVEPISKLVEPFLLLEQIVSRLGCLELKRTMHPFVSTVLLRISRFDSLQFYSQPHPPNRQPSHIPCRIVAGEWDSIVAANCRR